MPFVTGICECGVFLEKSMSVNNGRRTLDKGQGIVLNSYKTAAFPESITSFGEIC